MSDKYQWQSEIYGLWQKQRYVGLVQASTGAGKTIAMCKTLQQFQEDHPFDRILVITPSQKLNKMWEDELNRYQIKNYEVSTYLTAVNRMQRDGLRCDCMVCDECHRLATNVQGRVLEMNPKYLLGCSATPEQAVEILGKPMINIGVDEANLCDFTVHYTSFPMSKADSYEYESLSQRMRERAGKATGGIATSLPPNRDSYYDMLVRQRRDVCYRISDRIPYAIGLVKKHINQNIVIYVERRETMDKMVHALIDEGIMAVNDSKVSDYESGKVRVLVLCGKYREGWSVNKTSVVILASVNTRVIKNIQTIGRALRVDPNNPNKKAHIYMLMARGTSDENVVKSTASFYKGHYVVTTIEQELKQSRL